MNELVRLSTLFFVGFSVLNASAQPNSVMDTLFGVALKGNAKMIFNRVEEIYGKEVREIFVDDPMAQPGNSKVADDGTPIIYINRATGRNVSTIVHELYHFIQQKQGYPAIQWFMPIAMDNDANQKALKTLKQQIFDPILHYAFFDTLRYLNIPPDEAVNLGTRQSLEDGTLDRLFETMDTKAIALYYYNLKLVFDDHVLVERITNLLKKHKKTEGMLIGEAMSQLVIDARPLNPNTSVDALMKCLNILHEGQFLFIKKEWSVRQLGRLEQKIVSIEIYAL